MKDFDYYRTNKHEYHDTYFVKRNLKKELDQIPLTVEDRKKREVEISSIAIAEAKKLNQPYHVEQQRLQAEFWADAREDIGYDKYLNEEGVNILESAAYDRGHSGGYADTFSVLEKLADLYERLRPHDKSFKGN